MTLALFDVTVRKSSKNNTSAKYFSPNISLLESKENSGRMSAAAGAAASVATLDQSGGKADLVAVWEVHLADGIHVIEFEHGTTSGRRLVRLVDWLACCKSAEVKQH